MSVFNLRLSRVLPTLAGVGLLFSCATDPHDPLRSLKTTGAVPEPTARLAARSGESLDEIGAGYWLFQRKCLECHEPRVPTDSSASDWHPVMQGMSWNAGLTADEQRAVLAYLRAAAS